MRPSASRKAADTARFEALYEEHLDAVLRYALRRADPESAKDVAAQTFLVAWQKIDALPDHPLPWLYACARNHLLASHRGAAQRARLADREASLHGGDDVPDFAGDVVERRRVATAMAALPALDQEVLRLSAWEDLDGRSLGQALECSTATAAVRLHRARRRLAQALQGLEAPGAGRTGAKPAPHGPLLMTVPRPTTPRRGAQR